jgi:hypothetical protein
MLEIAIVKLTTAILAKLVDRQPSTETEEIAGVNDGDPVRPFVAKHYSTIEIPSQHQIAISIQNLYRYIFHRDLSSNSDSRTAGTAIDAIANR